MSDTVYALSDFTKDEFEEIKALIDRYTDENSKFAEDVGYFDLKRYRDQFEPNSTIIEKVSGEFPAHTVFLSERFDDDLMDGMLRRGVFREVVANTSHRPKDIVIESLESKRRIQILEIEIAEKERMRQGQFEHDEYLRQQREFEDAARERTQAIDALLRQKDEEKESERQEAAKKQRAEKQKRDEEKRKKERESKQVLKDTEEEADRQARDKAEQEKKKREEEFRRTAMIIDPNNPDNEGGGSPGTIGGQLGAETADELIRRLAALPYSEDGLDQPTCGTLPIRAVIGATGALDQNNLQMKVKFVEAEHIADVHMALG